MLKISKGQLEAASSHVATAVEPDSWLRVWLGPGGAGLVYASDQGGCACGAPAAVVRFRRDASGALEPLAAEALQLDAEQPLLPERLQHLVAAATTAWAAPSHPGWQVLQLGGQRFEVRPAPGGGGPGGALLPPPAPAAGVRCAALLAPSLGTR